jgi:aspartyl-tRNA(Asn)/glutamyl-tRNA(Gln) amidotransferase subunit B
VAEFPVSPAQVVELLGLVDAGTISGKQAKDVFAAIKGTSIAPAEHVAKAGLAQVSDEAALDAICKAVVAANPKQADAYRSGKTGMLGFFVGQVMKETGGAANPGLVNELLKRALSDG